MESFVFHKERKKKVLRYFIKLSYLLLKVPRISKMMSSNMVHEKENVMEKTTWTMCCCTCEQANVKKGNVGVESSQGCLIEVGHLAEKKSVSPYLIIFKQLPHKK